MCDLPNDHKVFPNTRQEEEDGFESQALIYSVAMNKLFNFSSNDLIMLTFPDYKHYYY